MKSEMTRYFEWLLQSWQQLNKTLPKIPRDEEAEQSLYVGEPDEAGWVCWKPVEKTVTHDLSGIEEELGTEMHASVDEYFNCYWFCALGGKYKSHSVQLEAVLPGIELRSFVSKLASYKSTHQGAMRAVPIGVEKNGLLVVVDNATGKVLLEDYEEAVYEPLADSLEQLIAELR